MHFLKRNKIHVGDLDSQATTPCVQSALPPSGPFSPLALDIAGPQDPFLHIHEGAAELIQASLLSAQAVPAVVLGPQGPAAEHIVSPLRRCCPDASPLAVDRAACWEPQAPIFLSLVIPQHQGPVPGHFQDRQRTHIRSLPLMGFNPEVPLSTSGDICGTQPLGDTRVFCPHRRRLSSTIRCCCFGSHCGNALTSWLHLDGYPSAWTALSTSREEDSVKD